MKRYIELTDIIREMKEAREELRKETKRLDQYTVQKAKAEQAYQVALRQEIMKLRAKGEPVGLIQDVVRGVPVIAEKRLNRDIAIDQYKNTQEVIKNLREEINMLRSMAKYQSDY